MLPIFKVAALMAALAQGPVWPANLSARVLCQSDVQLTQAEADALLVDRYDRTIKVDGYDGGDEYFGWKDIKAAARRTMDLHQYAILGVNPHLRVQTALLFLAAMREGMLPGITAGYRDCYRQGIATGHKGKTSWHGCREDLAWGNGRAIDVVGLTPLDGGYDRPDQVTRSQIFWEWIDRFGELFDIGRPYGAHDGGHIGLRSDPEYQEKHLAGERRRTHHRTARAKHQARHRRA